MDPLSPEQRRLLATPDAERSPEERRRLFDAFRLSDATFTNLDQQIDNAWTNWPYPPTTLVLQQRSRPQLFSNALPPTVACSALRAIQLMLGDPGLLERLREKTSTFRAS